MKESISTLTNSDFPQHSIVKSLGLHVLPGILVTLAFLVFKPLLDSSGFPPLSAFLLAVVLVAMRVILLMAVVA